MIGIDIVVPCHNEQEVVSAFLGRLEKVVLRPEWKPRVIFVDDGSGDSTFAILSSLASVRPWVTVVKFARNFGKEAAIAAGLKHSTGDLAITMDCDLQHPPELIERMVAEWVAGAQIVDAVKIRRQKEIWLKRAAVGVFTRLVALLTGMRLSGAADYKLLDKAAVDAINALPERSRFFRGLTNWIGMRHVAIEFAVPERTLGRTKWGGLSLSALAVDAVVSFTSTPLQLVTGVGIFGLAVSVVLALDTLYNYLRGDALGGFTTVILVTLIMGSLILIGVGVVGLYLAKIYDEVKGRPLYVIERVRAGGAVERPIREYAVRNRVYGGR
jgi:polyisoprenyl-phosphate glycosyltransferase